MANEEYNKWLILYFDMQSINLQFNCNDIASSLKAQRDKIKQFCIDCLTGVKHQADSFLFDTNACIFSTCWVFYKGAGRNGKNYVIIVYDNGTTKELSVVSNVYSISTGPYNYCCVGVLYQGGARIYTFLATSVPDSLTYYTPGMFTPNVVIQGAYASPRGMHY